MLGTAASCGPCATRRGPVFWRCTIATLNTPSQTSPPAPALAGERGHAVPKRWTLHGLNNGVIFGATCRGVSVLPRQMSYAIGDAATWIAWRTMAHTRAALVDNLSAVFPNE